MTGNIIKFPQQEKGGWLSIDLTQEEMNKLERVARERGKPVQEVADEIMTNVFKRLNDMTDEEIEFAAKHGMYRPFLKVIE